MLGSPGGYGGNEAVESLAQPVLARGRGEGAAVQEVCIHPGCCPGVQGQYPAGCWGPKGAGEPWVREQGGGRRGGLHAPIQLQLPRRGKQAIMN